ncbi:MAG TPA: alanine racemase, partial [Pyrinomonadaceae bacterium]|nr:alanine racemase [Pyrinomonadaceae bacterium]
MLPENIKTPALVLDAARVRRNAARMSERARALGVRLRPHVKTHKCVEVARIQTEGGAPALTVSTLAEARAFSSAGFTDITYAVPIEPGKFEEAVELSRLCERFALITDDADIPPLLDAAARRAGVTLDLLLKVDCG